MDTELPSLAAPVMMIGFAVLVVLRYTGRIGVRTFIVLLAALWTGTMLGETGLPFTWKRVFGIAIMLAGFAGLWFTVGSGKSALFERGRPPDDGSAA